VLLVLGALLLARFVTWSGRRITERIDAASTDGDALVRSEAAKHRQAVAQVLTWVAIALIWSITGVMLLERLGVPVASLVAPAAVLGAALGFGAQQVVRDLIAGFFIIVDRQYGFGDVVHISAVGFVEGATGTIEEVALRTTRSTCGWWPGPCPASSSTWTASCGSGSPWRSSARASSPPRARPISRTRVAHDGAPLAGDAAARQASDLDSAAVRALSGGPGAVPSGPAPTRGYDKQRGRIGAGPGATSGQIPVGHDVAHLDSDLRACDDDNDNQGSGHLVRPHCHHTDASTNHDQFEGHREPATSGGPTTSP
jgi:Mechanosensitive ion channel